MYVYKNDSTYICLYMHTYLRSYVLNTYCVSTYVLIGSRKLYVY